jgi:hypothetical protein
MILAALAVFPLAAFASELSPGTFELSGSSNLSFASSTTKMKPDVVGATETSIDGSTFGLSADGLYYFVPNFGVGLSVSYKKDSSKVAGVETGSSTFLVGPMLGYDHPIAPEFALFARGALGYASGSQTDGTTVNLTGYGAQLGAGVKYFPLKPVSFNVGLSYTYLSLDSDTSPKVTSSTSGISFDVGLSIYFGTK